MITSLKPSIKDKKSLLKGKDFQQSKQWLYSVWINSLRNLSLEGSLWMQISSHAHQNYLHLIKDLRQENKKQQDP